MLSSVFFIICKTNTNKIGQVNLTGAYVRLQLIRAYFGHLTLSPVRWIHNELKNKHRTRQIVDCWNICVFHAVKPRFGIAAIIQVLKTVVYFVIKRMQFMHILSMLRNTQCTLNEWIGRRSPNVSFILCFCFILH